MSSSGTFKPQKLVQALSPYVILFFIYLPSQAKHLKQFGKALNSILIQIALNFYNSFSSFIQKDINLLLLYLSLNILSNPLICGNIKTNNLLTLSEYLVKYLELVFVSTNFEITILSILTSQIFIGFFSSKKFFFCYFYHSKSQHYYTIKTFFVIIFQLIDMSLKMRYRCSCSCSDSLLRTDLVSIITLCKINVFPQVKNHKNQL